MNDKEYQAAYRAANADRIHAKQREWRLNNPEKVAANKLRYLQRKMDAYAQQRADALSAGDGWSDL